MRKYCFYYNITEEKVFEGKTMKEAFLKFQEKLPEAEVYCIEQLDDEDF